VQWKGSRCAIAAQHDFPADFPYSQLATEVAAMLIADPGFYKVIAERKAGLSGAVSSKSADRRLGPDLDPSLQNKGKFEFCPTSGKAGLARSRIVSWMPHPK
jgi:hypothetical protein